MKHRDIPARVARLGRWGWAALRNGGTWDSNAVRVLVSRLLFSPCAYSIFAGVQPPWIQGDSKVGGRSRRLWKNTYLITDIERLEMDSVVARLVDKKRLNNLDYVE